MYSHIAIIAMAMAICHAFPQHSYGGGFGHSYGYGGGKEYEGYDYGGGYKANSFHIQHAAVPVVHKVAAVPVVQKVAAVPFVHKVALPVVHKAYPIVQKVEKVEYDHYAPPHYQFEYGVKDEKTGDIKEQHEERDGDVTKGYYSLHEPDGTIRIVHYTVDKHSGFQAVVEKQGKAVHPEQVEHKAIAVAPVYHKAIQVAPVYHKAVQVAPVYHKAIQVAPVYHKALEVAPEYKSFSKYY